MIGQVLLEGFGLGVLLMLVCAFGIRSGAVGMVHLYHEPVQARCGVYSCRYLKGIRKSTPACIFASATTPRRRPSRRCTRRRQILRSSQRRLRSRRLSRRRSSKKFGRFRSARRPFPVCLDEASHFPSWKRIHSSRSARARPPMRSTSLFSPRRALLFNPPSKPPRLTRSSQWQKRILASASCRRRSFVRLIMCAASNCKSPSRCVPCAS